MTAATPKFDPPSIDPTAQVDPSATLEEGVIVGAHASIAAGVTVGRGTKLDAYVRLAEQAQIGHDCHLHEGMSVGSKSSIGNCCQLGSDIKNGADSYVKHDVVIGDNVTSGHSLSMHEEARIESGCAFGSETHVGPGAHVHNDVRAGEGVYFGREYRDRQPHGGRVRNQGIAPRESGRRLPSWQQGNRRDRSRRTAQLNHRERSRDRAGRRVRRQPDQTTSRRRTPPGHPANSDSPRTRSRTEPLTKRRGTSEQRLTAPQTRKAAERPARAPLRPPVSSNHRMTHESEGPRRQG